MEIRPTSAALIDEEFVRYENRGLLPQANGVQRTFGTKGCRTKEQEDSRPPNGKILLKEFSVGHLSAYKPESKCLKFCVELPCFFVTRLIADSLRYASSIPLQGQSLLLQTYSLSDFTSRY